MEEILIGYIAEAWVLDKTIDPRTNQFGGEKIRFMQRWNEQIIDALPVDDSWPPLTRGMFTVSGDDPLHGGYRGRIIHFGGRYNGIWDSFDEWRVKYEALLRGLYLESSTVYFDTDFRGHLMYQWFVPIEARMRYLDQMPPGVPGEWEFDGPLELPRFG
jgi:hypothetical protein